MPAIVKHLGKVMKATTQSGDVVERREWLQLKNGTYPCLSSETHFVYRTRRLGSTMRCTCGMEAVIVGYQQYKKYSSYIGNEVVMCLAYAQNGAHVDGSH